MVSTAYHSADQLRNACTPPLRTIHFSYEIWFSHSICLSDTLSIDCFTLLCRCSLLSDELTLALMLSTWVLGVVAV